MYFDDLAPFWLANLLWNFAEVIVSLKFIGLRRFFQGSFFIPQRKTPWEGFFELPVLRLYFSCILCQTCIFDVFSWWVEFLRQVNFDENHRFSNRGIKKFEKKIESLRNIIFYHTYVIIMLSGRLGPLKPKNPILDRILADFRTWMVLLTLGTIVVW